MDNAKLNVVRFDESDVIATSIVLTISGFSDGKKGNGYIAIESLDGTASYGAWGNNSFGTMSTEGVYTMFNSLPGVVKQINGNSTLQELVSGAPKQAVSDLLSVSEGAGDSTSTDTVWVNINGTYIWNGSMFKKQ